MPLVAVILAGGASISLGQDKYTVRGRIVAYKPDTFHMLSGAPRTQSLIIRVEKKTTDETARPVYLRVLYDYWSEEASLPYEYFDVSKLFRFKFDTKSRCELRRPDPETSKPREGTIYYSSSWEKSVGAEKEALPDEYDLPCYRFSRTDMKEIKKGK